MVDYCPECKADALAWDGEVLPFDEVEDPVKMRFGCEVCGSTFIATYRFSDLKLEKKGEQ